MCMAHTAARVSRATEIIAGSPARAVMSLMISAPAASAALRHRGLRRIDGNRHQHAGANGLDHRNDAPEFFADVDPLAVRARAFTADVENVGPFGG